MQKNSMRSCRLAATFSLLIFTLFLNACHRNQYIIPLQETANEQFYYATIRHRRFDAAPRKQRHPSQPRDQVLSMTERQQETGAIAIAAYEKVIEAFPEESLHVNRAYLGIARVKDDMNRDKEALKIYENLIRQVPNDEIIQVHALYYAAKILDQQKKFERANEYYRQVIDRFRNTDNPEFAKIVLMAATEYEKVGRR